MSFTFGKIRIIPKHLIYATLILTLFMGTLVDDFGLSSVIHYVNDALMIMLFISLIIKKKWYNIINHTGLKYISEAMMVFTIVNLVSVVMNLVSINLVIWAMRNTYRFFVFYWACIVYLERKDLDHIFEMLYKLQWVNVLVVGYQYFVLGLKQDFLGGIFGHGGSSGLLIYCLLLLAYSVSKYTLKEYSLFKFLFVLISTSIISALAELKVFFAIVVVILFINFFRTKFTVRKILVASGAIALFFITVIIYSKIFPYVNLSIESFIREGTSVGGGYNISRLNAFSEINTIFFKDDFLKNFIGFGFGNCEYSTLDIFCSNFYKEYGFLNYRWFTHQWVFLETGIAGVISFCSIFIAVFIHALSRYKKLPQKDKVLMLTSAIIAAICLVMFFYNSLLKADYGYIAFFALAVSGVLMKPRQLQVLKDEKNDK